MPPTGLIESKTNGHSLAQIDAETLSKLVLNGDLASMTQDQKTAYYVYRCKAAGLDPATKPFDLLTLNGKQVLYATKECSAQISQRDKLSVTVVTDGAVADIYRVVARATSPDGRCTDDMGCVNIKGTTGDALCNAMMKATTKAKRRAILTHAGLGMLDETELETIPEASRATFKPATPKPAQSADADAVPHSVTDAIPAVATAPAETSARPADCERVGILRTQEKPGTKKDKTPFIRTGVEMSAAEGGPFWANTFSTTDGAIAKKCAENGLDAWVKTKKNGEFLDLIYIEAIEG